MSPPASDHFNGKTFFQPHHLTAASGLDLLRWKFSSRPKAWPRSVAIPPQPPPPAPRGDEVVATWLGHASFLMQTTRGNFLIDPVFSERTSPFSWIGPKRVHPPGVVFEALPRIDWVLVSHDHYDHCDVATLRRLVEKFQPRFITPLRHADLIAQAGSQAVTELDWWQSVPLAEGATLTLTPSQHWSNRLGTPRNHRLWGGFFLNLGGRRVWFVGDTGYNAGITREIRERCGAPDLAMVPIGAYEPRWFMAPMHMNPDEAVKTHQEAGARLSLAMHWGTFQLTDEGRNEPAEALAAARTAAGVRAEAFRVLAPGESVVV